MEAGVDDVGAVVEEVVGAAELIGVRDEGEGVCE